MTFIQCQFPYKVQSNLYIKTTQRNLKMWPLWAVTLYIQLKLYGLYSLMGEMRLPFPDSDLLYRCVLYQAGLTVYGIYIQLVRKLNNTLTWYFLFYVRRHLKAYKCIRFHMNIPMIQLSLLSSVHSICQTYLKSARP